MWVVDSWKLVVVLSPELCVMFVTMMTSEITVYNYARSNHTNARNGVCEKPLKFTFTFEFASERGLSPALRATQCKLSTAYALMGTQLDPDPRGG